MKILICAHDFPPIGSPQSLRVASLARALSAAGHQVHVLTRVAAPAYNDSTQWYAGQISRASAGWVEQVMSLGSAFMRNAFARRPAMGTEATVSDADGSIAAVDGQCLNWKGRLVRRFYALLAFFVFPDHRSLWVRSAVVAGRRVCVQFRPDIIIGSHEPTAGVMVARALAQACDLPWIAELGDPILAPYTPARWKRRAFAYEREVVRSAAAVVVTSARSATLLRRRHGLASGHLLVLPQGFGGQASSPHADEYANQAVSDQLNLVYTGRFYVFRDPGPLVRAVLAVPDVVLTVAGPELPAELAGEFRAHPSRLRFLGSLSHPDALSLQRSADMLVNIGNSGMTQVPGKLMEYLGAGRPILHVRAGKRDPSAAFVAESRCGHVVANDEQSMAVLLAALLHDKRAGCLTRGQRLGEQFYLQYRWDALAGRLAELCSDVHQQWLKERAER